MQNNSYARQVKLLLLTTIPVFALLAFIVLVHLEKRQYPLSYFFGDPSTLMGAPFFVGFLTNIRVLFWCAGAAVCLLTYFLLKRQQVESSVIAFIASLGLINGVFMADDLFLIHEEVLPRYFYIPEKLVYLVYVAYILYFLLRFKTIIFKTDFLILIFSFILLGFTLLVDMVPMGNLHFSGFLLESMKFLGIVCLCLYSYRMCLRRIRMAFKYD